MEKTDIPHDTMKTDPSIHPSVFVAAGAQIMGDVRIAAAASVWYNSVLRGDVSYIEIGQRSNIQDGCIIHLSNGNPCIVGRDVTVGHGAILHGCTIEDGCLVGMGAIVLDGAVIKRGSLIAAGTIVRERTVADPLTMLAGIPARRIRTMPETTYETHLKWAAKYARLAEIHRAKGNQAG